MKRIYLDYAASTPVNPRVFQAMTPYFSEKFGNAGSLHSFGQEAIAAVDNSREIISKSIGADFREIIFTGSATEANNLAIRGALKAFRFWLLGFSGDGLKANSYNLKPRIIVSSIEHESVLETARDLEKYGVEVMYLPVNGNGIADLGKLEAALNDRTALVSVMYANNEIGAIQPIAEISKIIKNFKKQNPELPYPLFHTDAAQAFQFLDCNVHALGVDLMTLSAHKIYGPKGIGALYAGVRCQVSSVRKNNMTHDACGLTPIITGGGQEFGLRSGTENVPLIVGFAKAVELIGENKEKESLRIGNLKEYFWKELKKIYPHAEMNALSPADNYLPNVINIYFPNHTTEELLTKFDIAGLAASSGSACRSRAVESSYVLEAIRRNTEQAKKSIRFSFGRPTTKEDIDRALEIIRINST